eukprot:TRINITY_DN1544_c0_g1_i4.p2 TRINITY_DN1544_c0_g1~~TRINITY_DN1544_c0_g1_i4.p2  ORF type:complete len:305 (+),score=16.59 TRINITY_DN1544_c0_g1_i4:1516-2430(+)
MVNIVFKYINGLRHFAHLSSKRSDIDRYGLDSVLRRMLFQDVDFDLYHGSDKIMSIISEEYEYYLYMGYFAIVYKSRVGGLAPSLCSFRYCDVVDVSRNRFECFFECIEFLVKDMKAFDTNKFRAFINIGFSSGVPVSAIPTFEKITGASVCVVDDDVSVSFAEEQYTFAPKIIYGSLESGIKLLLKNGHYYVFWRLKDKDQLRAMLDEECEVRKEVTNTGKNKDFFFFDYETLYNPLTMRAIPYCVSYKLCSDETKTRVTLSTSPEWEALLRVCARSGIAMLLTSLGTGSSVSLSASSSSSKI